MRIVLNKTSTLNFELIEKYSYSSSNIKEMTIRYASGHVYEHEFSILPAKIFCEYLNDLVATGEDKKIGLLVVDDKLEEHLKGVEFKTLEEFKS